MKWVKNTCVLASQEKRDLLLEVQWQVNQAVKVIQHPPIAGELATVVQGDCVIPSVFPDLGVPAHLAERVTRKNAKRITALSLRMKDKSEARDLRLTVRAVFRAVPLVV
jgi:hypothetical protein